MNAMIEPAPPLRQMREALERERAAGVPFAVAWARAVVDLAPVEVDEWATILDGTRNAWEAAYERRAAPRAHGALALIGADRDAPAGDHAADTRSCEHCGTAIPEDAPRRRRYCSRRCQRAIPHHGAAVGDERWVA